VIVVVGSPLLGRSQDGPQPAGLSGSIAAAAATAGSTVELVGRVGEDADGEALVLALARAGVGHVALLRDPARATPVVATNEIAVTEADPLDETHAAEPELPPGLALEPADVDLALRYLTDYAVIVAVGPLASGALGVVGDAAGWSGARVIAVVAAGGPDVRSGLPADAIVLEASASDTDGAFGSMVGTFAAALDRGEAVEPAWEWSLAATGWGVASVDEGVEPD
jgi:hypothetical protein